MHGQSNAIDNQLLSDYLCVLSQLQSVYLSLSFLCFAYLAAAAQKNTFSTLIFCPFLNTLDDSDDCETSHLHGEAKLRSAESIVSIC